MQYYVLICVRKIMIKKLIFILNLLTVGFLFSQEEGVDHHIEYGFSLGVSNYTGDLSPVPQINQFGPSGGVFYRHHLRDKISVIRISLHGGMISAKESNTNFPLLKDRQNSFSTSFVEISGIYEYKFFDFRDIRGVYFMSPYIFGGLGASSVGTQGTVIVPFGVGTNFAVGKKLNIGIEFGARKTFSDEIDGFNDDQKLNSSHGTDWYYFTGLTFSRTVYNPICPD